MRIPEVVTATLPCKDEQCATAFAAYINEVAGQAETDGRNVAVKTTDVTAPQFLDMIALHAFQRDWTQGIEMTLAVADFLDTLHGRAGAR